MSRQRKRGRTRHIVAMLKLGFDAVKLRQVSILHELQGCETCGNE
ncbi:MAG TPA: hypothetical protein PKA83_16040 [Pirellulaceae bacterium]|nr:hypothetical protein [Pirellulaceae bacterium]